MPIGHRVEMTRLAGLRAWRLSDDQADVHTTWVPGAGMLGADPRGMLLVLPEAGLPHLPLERTDPLAQRGRVKDSPRAA